VTRSVFRQDHNGSFKTAPVDQRIEVFAYESGLLIFAQEFSDRTPHHLRAVVAQDSGDRGIDRQQSAFQVVGENQVGNGLEQRFRGGDINGATVPTDRGAISAGAAGLVRTRIGSLSARPGLTAGRSLSVFDIGGTRYFMTDAMDHGALAQRVATRAAQGCAANAITGPSAYLDKGNKSIKLMGTRILERRPDQLRVSNTGSRHRRSDCDQRKLPDDLAAVASPQPSGSAARTLTFRCDAPFGGHWLVAEVPCGARMMRLHCRIFGW